ncbi:hypothetical protein ACU636_14705 [Klebsiella aerogenes]|uniref:hypothetical protein n=1 Tax=Klebsiella aerogenes TaxID=548 RepID=UPI000575B403|nr:hypothetical protein [Klebsiella aerogenes]KHM36162.1 hypothetical protein KV34_04795 [Klebsiella aerogenes]
MSKNLNLFNKQAAGIFALLWENFPVKQIITYKKFGAELPKNYWDNINSPEAKKAITLQSVVDGTFSFLGENGYIKYQTALPEGFRDVRLTEKALTVLNKKIEALDTHETMGDKILSAVKDRTPSIIAGAVANLLTLGIKLATSMN